jgi:tetratricopeptide (TPR) repeat protein
VTQHLANKLGQAARGRDWLTVARAEAARLANPAVVEDRILSSEASLAGAELDVDGYIQKARQSHDLTVKTLGPDHPRALAGLMDIGDALSNAGRYDEAVAADETALAAVQRVLGPTHPLAAMISSNECEALNGARRFERALPLCQRALENLRVVGANAVALSYPLTQIGIARLGLGAPAEAIAPLEEAVAARQAARSAASMLGESRFALARALWSRAVARPRALALARQARTDYGGDSKRVAEIDAWLAAAR